MLKNLVCDTRLEFKLLLKIVICVFRYLNNNYFGNSCIVLGYKRKDN